MLMLTSHASWTVKELILKKKKDTFIPHGVERTIKYSYRLYAQAYKRKSRAGVLGNAKATIMRKG